MNSEQQAALTALPLLVFARLGKSASPPPKKDERRMNRIDARRDQWMSSQDEDFTRSSDRSSS